MGKILETLKRADRAGRRSKEESGPALAQTDGSADADESIPYIEVGRKGAPPDASPEVLALGPLPAARHSLTAYPMTGVAEVRPGPVIRGAALKPLPEAPESRDVAPAMSEWLIVHHDPEHPVSKQYRELLRSMRENIDSKTRCRLLFVPLGRGIGATTALLNLAIAAAKDQWGEVLVLDGNFADPGVAKQLGVADGPGLKELLTGRVSWEQAIRTTSVDSLMVLGTGKMDAALADRVAAVTLAQIIRDLAKHFSLILIDGPHWGDEVQVLKFCMGCDNVFAVVPQSKANEWLTADVVQRLGASGCRVAGAILTQQ